MNAMLISDIECNKSMNALLKSEPTFENVLNYYCYSDVLTFLCKNAGRSMKTILISCKKKNDGS